MPIESKKSFKIAPGPNRIETFFALMRMRQSSISLFEDLRLNYGDVVNLPTPRLNVTLIFHPDDIRYCLKENAKNYQKSANFKELTPLFGQGLLTSEGEKWRIQRKRIAPLFHMKEVGSFATDTLVQLDHTLQEWEQSSKNGEARDISSDMMKLTFAIAGSHFFGSDIRRSADAVADSLDRVLNFANRRMMRVFRLPFRLPLPEHRRVLESIRQIDKTVEEIIQEHISRPSAQSDMMSHFIQTGMNHQEIRDEAVTMLLAGHETTSSALAWTWYLLSKNLEVETRLAQELRRVLSGRAPTLDDYPKLIYTQQVFFETLRLYPPGAVLTRTALETDQIGGYPIPKKSMVVCCPWVTHRHPDFWESPQRFDPDRFEKSKQMSRHPFSYLPFGAGPRECIGRNFAVIQAVLIIASLAQRFRIVLEGDSEISPQLHVVLKPQGGVRARLKFKDKAPDREPCRSP